MAEYIEREALLKELAVGEEYLDNDTVVAVFDTVVCFPAAEVAPVVHGEWVALTECSNEGVYCSACHKKVYRADYAWCAKRNKVRSNYCPNCGAKMDGGTNDEHKAM